jgi:hypothetical protein
MHCASQEKESTYCHSPQPLTRHEHTIHIYFWVREPDSRSKERKLTQCVSYGDFRTALMQTLLKLLLPTLLLLSGCSPSWFGGKGKDEKLSRDAGYRTLNPECSNLQLTSSRISAPDTRKLVQCLNANGSLGPVAELMGVMSDAELDSVLELVNEAILDQPKVHARWDSLWRALGPHSEKWLSPWAPLLEQGELASSALRVLESSWKREPKLVEGVLKRLATVIEPKDLASNLDVALTLARARATRSLLEKLKGPARTGVSVESVVADLQLAAREVRLGKSPDAVKLLLQAAESGRLLRFLDRVHGTSAQEIQLALPSNAALMGALLQSAPGVHGDSQVRPGALVDGLMDLMGAVRGPQLCLNGGIRIEDGRTFALRELLARPAKDIDDVILRRLPLELVGLGSFCNLPASLSQHYAWAQRLARSPVVGEAHFELSALEKEGLIDLLLLLATPSQEDPRSGLRRYLPFLSELQARGALDDVLLIAALPPVQKYPGLQAALRTWIEPAPELDGKSLLDALLVILEQADPAELSQLIRKSRAALETPGEWLSPLLSGARFATWATEDHPVADGARDVLEKLSKRSELRATVLRLGQVPEFPRAMSHLAAMVRDGRGHDLIEILAKLFRQRLSSDLLQPIALNAEPGFIPVARHDWAASDLKPFGQNWAVADRSEDPCLNLDFSVRLDHVDNPKFSQAFAAFRGCVAQNPKGEAFARALGHLQNLRMADTGQSLYSELIGWIKRTNLTAEQVRELVDRTLARSEDARFEGWLQGVGSLAKMGDSLIEPVGEILRPIYSEARPPLRSLLDSLGGVLRDPNLPSDIRYLLRISDDADRTRLRKANGLSAGAASQALLPPKPVYADDALHSAVKYRECRPDSEISARMREIRLEHRDAVNNWEILEDGRRRRSYSDAEFREGTKFLIQKLTDPAQSSWDKSIHQALLNVMEYFRLKEGEAPSAHRHYEPGYFGRWLDQLSGQQRAIVYFHPEEKRPRVRLVNSFDSLEILLFNADFDYVLNDNFGLKYLTAVARAWGDEPVEVWPAEIRAEFSEYAETGRGDRPKTLREVVKAMRDELKLFGNLGQPRMDYCDKPKNAVDDGIILPPKSPVMDRIPIVRDLIGRLSPPGISDAKARMFNLSQVLPVLEEMLPESNHPTQGSIKVLRDLFWEMWSSTPREHQGSHKRETLKNNLSVVSQLVRLGLMRGIGKSLEQGPYTQDHEDFFSVFVEATAHPAIPEIMETLFRTEQGKALSASLVELGHRTRGDLAFTLLTMLRQPEVPLLDPALKWLLPVTRRYGNSLSLHLDGLGRILSSEDLAHWLETFRLDSSRNEKARLIGLLWEELRTPTWTTQALEVLSAVDRDPKALAAWGRMDDRLRKLTDSAEWQALKMGEAGRLVLEYLTEEAPSCSAQRMRQYLGERLASPLGRPSDIERLLEVWAREPVALEQTLHALLRSVGDGGVKEILDLVRRGISK